LTIDTLIAARKRGVRVRIIVPNRHTDAPWGVGRSSSLRCAVAGRSRDV
jgi:hypothetical protein